MDYDKGTKNKRYELIFDAILNERQYQDKKWGPPDEHPHDRAGWAIILRSEIHEAIQAWGSTPQGTGLARNEILQAISVACAFLEQPTDVTPAGISNILDVNDLRVAVADRIELTGFQPESRSLSGHLLRLEDWVSEYVNKYDLWSADKVESHLLDFARMGIESLHAYGVVCRGCAQDIRYAYSDRKHLNVEENFRRNASGYLLNKFPTPCWKAEYLRRESFWEDARQSGATPHEAAISAFKKIQREGYDFPEPYSNG